MADPHVTEALDGFDRLTVRLYRTGLVLAALMLLELTAAHALAGLGWGVGVAREVGYVGVSCAVWLAVLDLHLYDKRIRWAIHGMALSGAAATAVGAGLGSRVVWLAGLGFVYAALSALVLKEQFCFRIPGLRLVPLFLAGSLLPELLDLPLATAICLLPAVLLVGFLSAAKLRMPLTHDIGDRSRYQV